MDSTRTRPGPGGPWGRGVLLRILTHPVGLICTLPAAAGGRAALWSQSPSPGVRINIPSLWPWGLSRVQEEAKLRQQLLSQNDELLQSLRVELKVYKRLEEEHRRPRGTARWPEAHPVLGLLRPCCELTSAHCPEMLSSQPSLACWATGAHFATSPLASSSSEAVWMGLGSGAGFSLPRLLAMPPLGGHLTPLGLFFLHETCLLIASLWSCENSVRSFMKSILPQYVGRRRHSRNNLIMSFPLECVSFCPFIWPIILERLPHAGHCCGNGYWPRSSDRYQIRAT